MKKWLMIMMVGLLLTGCRQEQASEEDERKTSNQSIEDDEEQMEEENMEQETEETQPPVEEKDGQGDNETVQPTAEPVIEEVQEPEESKDHPISLELQETDNPRIMEILNVSGTYTDSVNNFDHFSYQIPQFHADSESAKALNQRIVDDIYPYVEGEYERMADDGSLLNYFITYEVVEYGDVVSLIVSIPYPNDVMYYYAYSYDFVNNKEVTNTELLALRGITEESFIETACEMEVEYLASFFIDGKMDEWCNAYIEEAKALTTVELPMYLDAEGILNVYVPFPSVAGASWYYHLCEF